MLIIRVELLSGITGENTEIARAHVINISGTDRLGNYSAQTFKGRCAADLDKLRHERTGFVENHPRKEQHVWHLVAKALKELGYGGD